MRIFDRFSEASEGLVKVFLDNLHRRKALILQAFMGVVKLVKLLFVFRVNIKIKIKKMNIGMKEPNHVISLLPSPEGL